MGYMRSFGKGQVFKSKQAAHPMQACSITSYMVHIAHRTRGLDYVCSFEKGPVFKANQRRLSR